MAALLAEIARAQEAEAVWRSERDAIRADAQRSDVAEEDHAWQAALTDGLD